MSKKKMSKKPPKKASSDKPVAVAPVKKLSYQSLQSEVEKPYADRKEVEVGRSGRAVKPRKYHMTASQKKELEIATEKLGRTTVNPFMNRVGLYFAQIEALIQLGPNEWHSFKTVFNKVREILESITL